MGSNSKIELQSTDAVPPDKETSIVIDINNKVSKKLLPPSSQFGNMFDDFYRSVINKSYKKFNYEEDLLNQAIFMEAIRQSSLQNTKIYLSSLS